MEIGVKPSSQKMSFNNAGRFHPYKRESRKWNPAPYKRELLRTFEEAFTDLVGAAEAEKLKVKSEGGQMNLFYQNYQSIKQNSIEDAFKDLLLQMLHTARQKHEDLSKFSRFSMLYAVKAAELTSDTERVVKGLEIFNRFWPNTYIQSEKVLNENTCMMEFAASTTLKSKTYESRDKTRNGAVQKVAATVLLQLKNIKIGNEEEDQEEEEEMSEDFTSTLPMAAVDLSLSVIGDSNAKRLLSSTELDSPNHFIMGGASIDTIMNTIDPASKLAHNICIVLCCKDVQNTTNEMELCKKYLQVVDAIKCKEISTLCFLECPLVRQSLSTQLNLMLQGAATLLKFNFMYISLAHIKEVCGDEFPVISKDGIHFTDEAGVFIRNEILEYSKSAA